MKRRDLLRALACAPWLTHAAGRAWAQEAAPATVVAAAFGRLPPPERIRRVFVAGPPASLLVGVLAPDKMLGWPLKVSAEARAWLAPGLRELPQIGRLAGRGSTVAAETLLELKPDLILDVGTVDATYVSSMQRVAEQTGLPCVLVQGRLAEHPAQLRELGRLLGVAERGERLAAWAEAAVALADRVRAAVPPEKRPRVYFGRSADGLETGLDGSINMEVVDFCGGRNVAAAAGRGGLLRASLEQVLAWDPEVIVTQDREFARRAPADPLWRSVAAVRDGRVHCAPSLPFGWLDVPPGVNRLIGVHWLLAKLYRGHPALADAPPLRTAAADFYRLFYGAEPAAAAFDGLLADSA